MAENNYKMYDFDYTSPENIMIPIILEPPTNIVEKTLETKWFWRGKMPRTRTIVVTVFLEA